MKRPPKILAPTSPKMDPVTSSRMMFGTLNPKAFSHPLFQRSTNNTVYDEVIEHTMRAEQLKSEYDSLKSQLDEIINAPDANAFCQFEKWQQQFQQVLAERESQLEMFTKNVMSFRETTNPSFVEVMSKKTSPIQFDTISYTLLVSNPQRGWFSSEDINKQNQDLRELIRTQENTIKVLSARLALFDQFRNKTQAQDTIKTLQNGAIPTPMQAAAPTRSVELRTTKKLMSKQLQELIDERKKVMAPKIEKKLQKRRERSQNQKAIVIQRVVRGFLARLEVKRMHKAATKIQSFWRGVRVRTQRGKVKLIKKQPSLFKITKRKMSTMAIPLIENTQNTPNNSEMNSNINSSQRPEAILNNTQRTDPSSKISSRSGRSENSVKINMNSARSDNSSRSRASTASKVSTNSKVSTKSKQSTQSKVSIDSKATANSKNSLV
ncbi:IQ calmodulin-binding motif family protein [Trichomonas vaginalis G3]|uniref:IQ calmodulin-binding motif family protein n=1 Tax=Trichomonas vaginalis (strain ATCC PRA-98 / G3) TaxID=412133 RepID=A2DHK1_TRIV3|nr:spermatogenesis-associated protein 17 family [Trichomonas vaginalis G3]EAY20049.1 IQ calmodulin-binding motif family protein [Trichomonas vaginalis G3]KAI5528000.1 spermatogenesis-associated protein 17 family [Trichomonas vaginalis G3]|eukprot:XP_001581035.1 IQ calmodulin-binding motif family protein [Trichomonas vaginalis G3]